MALDVWLGEPGSPGAEMLLSLDDAACDRLQPLFGGFAETTGTWIDRYERVDLSPQKLARWQAQLSTFSQVSSDAALTGDLQRLAAIADLAVRGDRVLCFFGD